MEFEGCGNSTKKEPPGRNPPGRRGEERTRVESDEGGRGPQRGPEPGHRNPQERRCQVQGEGHEQRTGAEGAGDANAVSYSRGVGGKGKLNQEQKPPMPAWRGVAEAVQGYGEVRGSLRKSRILQSLCNSLLPQYSLIKKGKTVTLQCENPAEKEISRCCFIRGDNPTKLFDTWQETSE